MESEKRISFIKSLRDALGRVLNPSSEENIKTQRENETTLKGNDLKELEKLNKETPEINSIDELTKLYNEEENQKDAKTGSNPIAKKRAELKVQANSIPGKRVGPKKQAKPVIKDEKEIEEK